ncbi:MAG: hypothetical protein A2521_01360 [Deltaproteobacteria bacterium RIFOXYD12_FULL_57_12]|nr:MAG: hypothetical protein A2521_01360 [Deltaproteobacteria bacterium RIFOXYD12_FULL_57_12]
MKNIVMLWVIICIFLSASGVTAGEGKITCLFPPDWASKPAKAKIITDALAEKSGLPILPRIVESYAQILEACNSDARVLVYAGSFVQAVMHSRGIGVPLVQIINGKEYYSGIMIYPRGEEPQAILEKYPELISYAKGASSGESSAKAATGGEASIGVSDHAAAIRAVEHKAARAAFVKNWWWESNGQKFPELAAYRVPGISVEENPDNILTASNKIPPEIAKKIAQAATESGQAFDAQKVVPFDVSRLAFSLELMKKGNIDPLYYNWE